MDTMDDCGNSPGESGAEAEIMTVPRQDEA